MSIYQFKPGAHLRGDAQAVGARLESLRARGNGLTPERVVADAKNESSVLHPYFEWDDAKAARQHRIDQAAYLIRMVVVVVDDEVQGDEKTFRAFVPVQKQTGEKVFESTAPRARRSGISAANSCSSIC